MLGFKLNAPSTGKHDLQIAQQLPLTLKQWNRVYAVENTHFRQGGNTAKKETAQPPERYEKRKKKKGIPYLTRGGNSNDTARGSIL